MVVNILAGASVLAFALFAALTAWVLIGFDPTQGLQGRSAIVLLYLGFLVLCLGLHVVLAIYAAGLVIVRFGEFEIGTRLIGLTPLLLMLAWLIGWWRLLHPRKR